MSTDLSTDLPAGQQGTSTTRCPAGAAEAAPTDAATSTGDQLEAERRAHAATKGQLTKTRKRVAGGVCPCCNRSFVNLGRHMAGQHPDYAEGGAA